MLPGTTSMRCISLWPMLQQCTLQCIFPPWRQEPWAWHSTIPRCLLGCTQSISPTFEAAAGAGRRTKLVRTSKRSSCQRHMALVLLHDRTDINGKRAKAPRIFRSYHTSTPLKHAAPNASMYVQQGIIFCVHSNIQRFVGWLTQALTAQALDGSCTRRNRLYLKWRANPNWNAGYAAQHSCYNTKRFLRQCLAVVCCVALAACDRIGSRHSVVSCRNAREGSGYYGLSSPVELMATKQQHHRISTAAWTSTMEPSSCV